MTRSVTTHAARTLGRLEAVRAASSLILRECDESTGKTRETLQRLLAEVQRLSLNASLEDFERRTAGRYQHIGQE